MKASTFLLCLAAAFPGLAQQTSVTTPTQIGRAETTTLTADKIVLANAGAHPTTLHTYLGVGVEATTDAMRSQLKLPPGLGVTVNYLEENGPAKKSVQLHDVLQKLDDQLLVNPEQLIALVRLHKSGDVIHLTLLREAAQRVVEVTLGERKVAQNELGVVDPSQMGLPGALRAWAATGNVIVSTSSTQPSAVNNDYISWLSPAARGMYLNPTTNPSISGTPDALVLLRQDPIARASFAGPVTIDDGQLSMSLQPGEGGMQLTVLDHPTGKVTFKGPIGTDLQWKQVPEDIRAKFEAWRAIVTRAPDATSK